jgi:ANTAR domain
MGGKPDVRVRRVYDEPDPDDGTRVLVDRVWPWCSPFVDPSNRPTIMSPAVAEVHPIPRPCYTTLPNATLGSLPARPYPGPPGGPVDPVEGGWGSYSIHSAAWDDSEVSAAHAYAGVVASLLGSAVAAHASSRLATQLQTALDSRVLIEQAKGVLMASEKVDAQTAFNRLRRQARNTRRPVPEVAREIIDGVWGSPNHRRPDKPGRGNKVAQEH